MRESREFLPTTTYKQLLLMHTCTFCCDLTKLLMSDYPYPRKRIVFYEQYWISCMKRDVRSVVLLKFKCICPFKSSSWCKKIF